VILEPFEAINEAFQAARRPSLNLFMDPAPFTLLYVIILLKLLLKCLPAQLGKANYEMFDSEITQVADKFDVVSL